MMPWRKGMAQGRPGRRVGVFGVVLALAVVVPVRGQELPVVDAPVEVVARVRHVVAVVLPAGVGIVDVVSGDAEYWDVSAAAHMAFVRPLMEGARSNVLILTDTGAILPLVVIEASHEAAAGRTMSTVVRVDTPVVARSEGLASTAEVSAARQRAVEAWAEVSRAEARAEEQVAAARTAVGEALDEIRESYPRQLEFVYRFPPEAGGEPWWIEGMWHDGERTFIRSPAELVVLETVDGSLVPVEASVSDGAVYVVPRVLGAGTVDVTGARIRWTVARREVGP